MFDGLKNIFGLGVRETDIGELISNRRKLVASRQYDLVGKIEKIMQESVLK